ncbi:hypothetical protein BASA81_003224 [Batrachochytrium salamandrivorans]|nr:hypothetical protein BASA81_003224 [Batrachochytrium salamandrivorans]
MESALSGFQSALPGSSHMEKVVGAFRVDMAEPDSSKRSIRMLETFVQRLPTGLEQGTFYALDLGGTHFRVCKFVFCPPSAPKRVREKSYTLPAELKRGEAGDLFDFLAKCVCEVAQTQVLPRGATVESDELEEKDGALPAEGALRLGFTFSFPVQQLSLNTGKLIVWTKGWTVSGVEGQEVGSLLLQSLSKRLGRNDSELVCLVNDTVGTLAAGALCHGGDVKIGLILGTGTNAAFFNPQTGLVVNTEWGAFSNPLLPETAVDLEVDRASPHPGQQRFEKLISGYYLGEILRVCLHHQGWLGNSGKFVWDSKVLSDVESDSSSDLRRVGDICRAFGKCDSTRKERVWFKQVCESITERAARLTACAVTALVRKVGHGDFPVKIAVDGSLFEYHTSFRSRLERALKQLRCNCVLVLAKDGSGLGAALVAAAAASSN